MSTQFVNGTILHSMQANASYPNNGPFLSLQAGDSGVRSVESVTIGGAGDKHVRVTRSVQVDVRMPEIFQSIEVETYA